MARTLTRIRSAMVLLAAIPIAAAARAPAPVERQLLDAHRSGDPAALARAAERAGTGNVLQLLLGARDTDGERALLVAAITAAPQTPRSWTLIAPLVALATGSHGGVAVAALGALVDIAERLQLTQLLEHEHPLSLLEQPQAALLRLAQDTSIPPPQRAAAVRVLAQLEALLPLPLPARARLLAAPDATVRRAAVELFAAPSAANRHALVAAAGDDPTAAVARAAAAALCAQAANSRRVAKQIIVALRRAAAVPRLRGMVRDHDATRDELIDLERCLAVMHRRGDRAARAQLRSRLRRWSSAEAPRPRDTADSRTPASAPATPGAPR